MPRILLTQADANVEIDTQLNTSPRITAAEHRDLLKSIVQSLNFLVEGSFLNGSINPNSSRVDIGKNEDFYFNTFQRILYGPKTNDGWGTGVVTPSVASWAADGNTTEAIPNSVLPDTATRSNDDIVAIAKGAVSSWAEDGNTDTIPSNNLPDDIAHAEDYYDDRIDSGADARIGERLPLRVSDASTDIPATSSPKPLRQGGEGQCLRFRSMKFTGKLLTSVRRACFSPPASSYSQTDITSCRSTIRARKVPFLRVL